MCDPLPVNTTGDGERGVALRWWRRFDLLPLAWVLVTVVAWGARGFADSLNRDAAFYVYAGQQIAAGNAPYVEVMNRAGPYANLLPALGVELGRLLGTSDAVGARLLFFALFVTTPAISYLTARDMFRSRLAGCAAAATLLGFLVLAKIATLGPESKMAMMAGLCVTLLLLVRRRWLLAGIATGLVTLTWQPALFALAPAAAVLVLLSGGPLRERVRSALWYGAGGLAALLVTIAGFALADALDAFVEGFWTANAEYTQQRGAMERPWRVWEHLQTAFGWNFWLLPLGSLAALALGVDSWRLRRTAPRQAADRAMLGVSCLGGLVWSGWFAFDRSPDTLLLLPAAALGVGGVVGLLAHLVRRAGSRLPWRILVGAVAVWTAVSAVTAFEHTLNLRSEKLHGQQASSDALFDNVPADATVFSVEVTPPLALSGRKSISRFVIFKHGMLSFIEADTPGGVQGYLEGLIEAEPDIVLFPRAVPRGMWRELLRPYDLVGYGPSWRVFLRRDLDEEARTQVAEALDEARE